MLVLLKDDKRILVYKVLTFIFRVIKETEERKGRG